MGSQVPLEVPMNNSSKKPINSQEGSQHESEEGPEVRARKRSFGGKSVMQVVGGDHFLSSLWFFDGVGMFFA